MPPYRMPSAPDRSPRHAAAAALVLLIGCTSYNGPETVTLDVLIGDPDQRCWEHQTIERPGEYWHVYASDTGCHDTVTTYATADGTCVSLPQYCDPPPDPQDDPWIVPYEEVPVCGYPVIDTEWPICE